MTEDRYVEVYRHQAERYEELIRHEDADGHLPRLLTGLLPAGPFDLLDIGAGTGRISALLHARARSLTLVEKEAAMLDVARAKLAALGRPDAVTLVGTHDALPVPPASADVAIAGWTFGHATGWYPDAWPKLIRSYVTEQLRALRPAGHAIVIEGLGLADRPPSALREDRRAYHALLESELRFTRHEIRTDFAFASPDDAVACTRFFFGDAIGDAVAQSGAARVPEWTGVWHRSVAAAA